MHASSAGVTQIKVAYLTESILGVLSELLVILTKRTRRTDSPFTVSAVVKETMWASLPLSGCQKVWSNDTSSAYRVGPNSVSPT